MSRLAREGIVAADYIGHAKVLGWERAVDHFLEDGQLSASEEERLAAYRSYFLLDQDQLDKRGALTKLVKAGVIRDLLEGKVPSRMTHEGGLPFNLQKGEVLVWMFLHVPYYEDRVRREYVGRSSGVSIRIARGLYYRVGAFRGHPIETTHRIHVDTGGLAVTTKHLYFAGGKKSLRIRHDKIISLIPFDNGIGVHRDAASAKPQLFLTGDGWFTYNLLSNMNALA